MKHIADFERENKTLKGANKAFNRALKTNIEAIDDENKMRKKEKKPKEVLRMAIHHIVDPLIDENLNKVVQDL